MLEKGGEREREREPNLNLKTVKIIYFINQNSKKLRDPRGS